MTFDKNLMISTINDWRHLRKLTIRQLAELADIPEPTLQTFLSGKVDKPSFESVCSVCNALEHPITELEAILRYREYKPEESKGTKYLLHKEEEHMRELDLLRNEQLSFYRTRLDDHKEMHEAIVKTKDELIQALKRQILVMDKLLYNYEQERKRHEKAETEAKT